VSRLLEDLDTYTTAASVETNVVATVAEPIRWHRDAACAADDVDPEWFYVERGGSTKAARDVCARCIVQEQCLEYALSDPDARAWGVWGGTTPRERRGLR